MIRTKICKNVQTQKLILNFKFQFSLEPHLSLLPKETTTFL